MENLTHILNYDILKEWGFVWGQNMDGQVMNYYIERKYAFSHLAAGNLLLSVYPDLCGNRKWALSLCNEKECVNLYFGLIPNDEVLTMVLENTLVYKDMKNR